MEKQLSDDQCQHNGCGCDHPMRGEYCSDHCRMAGLEGSGGECMCGHPECGCGGG